MCNAVHCRFCQQGDYYVVKLDNLKIIKETKKKDMNFCELS